MKNAAAALLLTLLVLAACGRNKEETGPHREPVATARLDAGSDAGVARVPATAEDDRHWRRYAALLNEGRAAMHDKRYDDAVSAFDRVFAFFPRDPRALFERGMAYSMAKRPADARLDFESARDRAWEDALSAQIAYELGVAREQLGDEEGARASYELVQSTVPSERAGDKLIRKSSCNADVDERHVAADVVARGWRAAWSAIASDYARDHGDTLAIAPVTTDDDARAALCTHGCDGAGPWSLAFGAEETLFTLAIPRPGGSLALFFRVGRGQPAPCPGEDRVTIDASSSPVHVVSRSDPEERTFTFENVAHQRSECTSSLVGCSWECIEHGWSERDAWYDVATATRVLFVERAGRVAGLGKHKEGRVQIAQKNGTVFVVGDGCNAKVAL